MTARHTAPGLGVRIAGVLLGLFAAALAGCRQTSAPATLTPRSPDAAPVSRAANPAPAPRPDPAAITRALDSFAAESPSCLWAWPIPMPYCPPAALPLRRRGLQALVQAGLLARSGPAASPLFSLTPAGMAAWTPSRSVPGAGNFCYGTRRLTHIDSITTSHDPDVTPAQDVSYQAAYVDVPAWARKPAIQQVYPLLGLELNQPLPHSATVAWRNGAWITADGPAGSIAEPISHDDPSYPKE